MKLTRERFRYGSVYFLAVVLPVLAASPCFAEQDGIEAEVQRTIQRFQHEEPRAAALFETAYGYMVFPSIEKGAAIVGGAYGEGLVYEEQRLVGRARMTHLTLGVQAGGGTYSEVIFFDSEATMNQFREREIVASNQASAFGPHDSDSANVSDRPGMSVFTRNRSGGFLEASAGAKMVRFVPLAQ